MVRNDDIARRWIAGETGRSIAADYGISPRRARQIAVVQMHRTGAVRVRRPKPSKPRRLTPEERFWAKVDTSGECWIWRGVRLPTGYGRITGVKRGTYTHRFSWELHNGPVPDGLFVCHHCDNPPCVRPDHLFLGTALDNCRDRDAKGRGRPGGRAPKAA